MIHNVTNSEFTVEKRQIIMEDYRNPRVIQKKSLSFNSMEKLASYFGFDIDLSSHWNNFLSTTFFTEILCIFLKN